MYSIRSKANQKAFIEFATVEARNVYLLSKLNEGRNDGAVAQLGSITSGSFEAELIGGSANVAIAKADALSHAYTKGASVDVGGNTFEVISNATGNAVADVVLPSVSIGLASIGANVVRANANGSFLAAVNGASGNVNVKAGTLRIHNNYSSSAKATTAQSVSIKAVNGQVNVANAGTGTKAAAGVNVSTDSDSDGSGGGDPSLKINASTIQILANGKADAMANVGKQSSVALVEITANILTANVSGVQKAQLNKANVTAGSISVRSRFNPNSEGAVAVLGSPCSGGEVKNNKIKVKASQYSLNVNTVFATMAGSSKASINASGIIASGAVDILNDAKSFAKAYTEADDANVGLVGVGVIVVNSFANGNFDAYVSNSEVEAGSLAVRSNVTARSEAIAEQPCVSVSFAETDVNVADAETGTKNNAYIKNSEVSAGGSANIYGAVYGIHVYADATATAYATIKAPIISLSGFKLLISDVDAIVSPKQYAYIKGGSIKSVHGVRVVAWLNDNGEQGAVAELGSASLALEAVSIKTNEVFALVDKKAESKAYVKDTYFGSADKYSGSLVILSQAESYAKAHFSQSMFAASFASVGVMWVKAEAYGRFEAYLDSGDADIYVKDIDINLTYKSTSSAKSTQPGKGITVSGLSGKKNEAWAYSTTVGKAILDGDGNIYAKNFVKVLADGSGSVSKRLWKAICWKFRESKWLSTLRGPICGLIRRPISAAASRLMPAER